MPVSLESITQYVAHIRVPIFPSDPESPAAKFTYKTNVITSDLIIELEAKAKEEAAAEGQLHELAVQDRFNRWALKKALVGWDIVAEDGETLPITDTNIGKLDLFYRQRVWTAIRESVSEVDPTTKRPSDSA